MSTFNLGGYSTSDASSLANTLQSLGAEFTLTPSSNGYTLNTSNSAADNYLSSAGIGTSSGSTWSEKLADIFGNADTSNDGAGSGVSNNNGVSTGNVESSQSAVSSFFSKFGADAISIVVGIIIILAAVWRIV